MLALVFALLALASSRRPHSRRRHGRSANDDDSREWARLKQKLKLMARVRAQKHAEKVRSKKMNNLIMNSILYKLGMTGPLDVTDPVSLAFIRAHSEKGEKLLDKGLL